MKVTMKPSEFLAVVNVVTDRVMAKLVQIGTEDGDGELVLSLRNRVTAIEEHLQNLHTMRQARDIDLLD